MNFLLILLKAQNYFSKIAANMPFFAANFSPSGCIINTGKIFPKSRFVLK
jgi:hypothetical protein